MASTKIQGLPDEITEAIFVETCSLPGCLADRAFLPDVLTAVSEDVRFLPGLRLVCKTWSRVGYELMHQHIYLDTYGKMEKFQRLLLNHEGDHDIRGRPIAIRTVRSPDFEALHPYTLFEELWCIITSCPNLRAIDLFYSDPEPGYVDFRPFERFLSGLKPLARLEVLHLSWCDDEWLRFIWDSGLADVLIRHGPTLRSFKVSSEDTKTSDSDIGVRRWLEGGRSVSRLSIDVLPDQNYFSHRRCLDILDALGPAVLQELVIVNDWKGVAADDESAACRILARYGGELRDLKIVEGRPINQTKGEEAGLEDAIRGCSHLESLDIDGDVVTGSTLSAFLQRSDVFDFQTVNPYHTKASWGG